MQALGAQDPRLILEESALAVPRNNPLLDFRAATERARQLAEQESMKQGLVPLEEGESWLWHVPTSGMYVYGFTTAADIGHHGGGTGMAFDSNTGEMKAVYWPSGVNGTNTFSNWLTALHMAQVFGLPYRIFVSMLGLLVTMLSVTGVVIWLKKRSARAGSSLRVRNT